MIKMKKGFFVFVVVFSLVCGALCVLTVQTLNNEGIINIGSTVQISKDELSAYQNMVGKYSKAELLRTFLEEKYYVDIKDEDLEYGMLSGLVASIGDPYTYYMNEEEYASFLIDSTGTYSGVGIVMTVDPDTQNIIVNSVKEESPAEEGGVRAGDLILKVDGVEYSGSGLDECARAVRGKEKTSVTIEFQRGQSVFEKSFIRRTLINKTVSSKMIDAQTAYIKLSGFEEASAKDFETALNEIKKQGAEKFILDLRDNPGGLVNICTQIADLLMNEGTIVYAEDHDGNRENFNTAAGRTDMEYVVLINGNSASCSEMLAAGIQDNKEALIVGTTSFGKGIMQNSISLPDGSALKYTFVQFFSPNGNVIHKKGIAPDYLVELDEDCYDKDGNLVNDKQLQKALELLNR